MSDNLLSNIIVLDVSKQSEYFNYFIIATGLTSQHLESSGNTITKHLKDLKIKINHKEGLSNGGWVLLDYPGLVIHLFLEDQFQYHHLFQAKQNPQQRKYVFCCLSQMGIFSQVYECQFLS